MNTPSKDANQKCHCADPIRNCVSRLSHMDTNVQMRDVTEAIEGLCAKKTSDIECAALCKMEVKNKCVSRELLRPYLVSSEKRSTF